MDPVTVPLLHQALKAIYGSDCQRNTNHLSTLLRKRANSAAGLHFLLNCRSSNVFPSFIQRTVKFSSLGLHMGRIAARLPRRLLRAAIRDLHVRLARLDRDLQAVWMWLTEFAEFEAEVRKKPSMLNVKSRLLKEDLLDQEGYQRFKNLTAQKRFPITEEPNRTEVHDTEVLDRMSNVLATVPEMSTDGSELGVAGEVDLEWSGHEEEIEEPEVLDQRPVMVTPYVPVLSDRLHKVASGFGFCTWFKYPGKVAEMFTAHRNRTHKSKIKNSVYCCYCKCGKQYVGESMRNLKVRLSEHQHPSSNSSLSIFNK